MQQVDAFVSEIERLNGQLMILENGMPETAPEGRGKRQYSVQVEVFQNKMKEVNRALEVFKVSHLQCRVFGAFVCSQWISQLSTCHYPIDCSCMVPQAALGHHYQPNLPPEPPLPAPAQPPVVPQAAEGEEEIDPKARSTKVHSHSMNSWTIVTAGATPRRLSLSEQAHDPER